MQLDFQFKGVRYMLNFEDYLVKEYAEKGEKTVELRVYYSLKSDSLYASSMKMIKDHKLVWNHSDDTHLTKEVQDHCDRLVGLAVFA